MTRLRYDRTRGYGAAKARWDRMPKSMRRGERRSEPRPLTEAQALVLVRKGLDPEKVRKLDILEASQVIDDIKTNGWRPPPWVRAKLGKAKRDE